MSQITKRALEESLKKMLIKKPLDKITVSDLTDDCGISRMTFYYHFKDIYDLVEWACVEDAARALKGKKTYDTWQMGFLQMFQAVEENKDFFISAYRSVNKELVEVYLHKLSYDLLYDVVEETAQGMNVRQEDKEFIANFYKFGFVGIMLEWISNGMKEEPKHIIDRLSLLIHGDFKRALQEYSTDSHKNKI